MRITSGRCKGRILHSPDGITTRPTADRARQAVFNILCHAGWRDRERVNGAFVLDGFAGTGALGIEALSRGAADAVFIDTDKNAIAAVRRNIADCKLGDAALILKTDITRMAPRPAHLAPRDLVFLDPPYGLGLCNQAIAALLQQGWLAPDALCVCEMAADKPEDTPAGFRQMDERKYGVAHIVFLQRI